MTKHNGSRVKRSGTFVKEQDYNGDYAIEIQTEDDEAFEFVLEEEELQRLNTLTEEPYGKCETEKTWVERLTGWFRWG